MDVIVVGCGASGMAAAIRASERNCHVLVLEKGDRPGRKVLASGNGRCNLMNFSSYKYFGDPRFALQVLSHQSPEQITSFFYQYGLFVKEYEEGRVYPRSLQSASVLSSLKTAMKKNKVLIQLNQHVTQVRKVNESFRLTTAKGDTFSAKQVIVACGGAVQPKLGGSYDGYRILNSFGHSIVPVKPALVPLTTEPKSISGLSGIRVRCTVSLCEYGRTIHKEEGEVLFTDYGISGICIMQCARFITSMDAYLELDFLQDLFADDILAQKELLRRRTLFPDWSPSILLDGIIAERISFAIMKQANIPMKNEKVSSLSDQDLMRIIHTAHKYKIGVTGNKGFDFAQVTAGGACCKEFNPISMESRLVPGLYATGEVLNVDGDCGGFNLMFAFSSGLVAGNAVSS